MKTTCEFCNEYISDTDENCPHCGAKNPNYKRVSHETPQTIEELKQWYKDHHLPPEEVTRFFIGKNYKKPKAFGIYEENGRFIVYKNKADGSRAIRYDGADEAYAVNELYQKLKEEISRQKRSNRSVAQKNPKKEGLVNRLLNLDLQNVFGFLIVFFILIISFILSVTRVPNGYYQYQNKQYYHLDDSWYEYDEYYSNWEPARVEKELQKNHEDYFESSSYSSDIEASDFSETTYYENWLESENDDSDWDSDSDWNSGSDWDSGGTDWDSDW